MLGSSSVLLSPYPQQLVDRPWDREAQSVFADQLAASDDPTGEFLALSLSLTDTSLPAARRGWQARRRLAELEPRLTSALRHRTALERLTGAQLGLERGLVSFIQPGSASNFAELWRSAARVAPIRKATLFLHEGEPSPAAELFEKLDTLHLESGTLDRLPMASLPLGHLRDLSINGDVPAGWRWLGTGGLEALRFGSGLPLRVLRDLSQHDGLRGLRRLTLRPGTPGLLERLNGPASWLEAVSAFPLQELSVDLSAAPSLPLARLAQTRLAEGLEALTVTGADRQQLHALLSTRWPALRRLEVTVPEGAVAWGDAPALSNLQQLGVRGGSGWGPALAQAEVPRLSELRLQEVDEAILRIVSTASWFDALESLRIGFAPANVLGSFPSALRLLVVRDSPLSAAAVHQVLGLPHLARLELQWTAELEQAVASSESAANLRGLTLWCARDVTGAPDWLRALPALERLELEQVPLLTKALASALARHSSLGTLSVWCGRIDAGAEAMLRERFGDGLVLGVARPGG